jgi:glutamate/tyrosine decarboxylase-like PLP-dependent enzyme
LLAAGDFALKNVASINASGHKFGLVYPGLGWVMWRNRSMLPDSLVFHVSLLPLFEWNPIEVHSMIVRFEWHAIV